MVQSRRIARTSFARREISRTLRRGAPISVVPLSVVAKTSLLSDPSLPRTDFRARYDANGLSSVLRRQARTLRYRSAASLRSFARSIRRRKIDFIDEDVGGKKEIRSDIEYLSMVRIEINTSYISLTRVQIYLSLRITK